MRATQELGRHGEDLAAAMLAEAGMAVLARNWRCPDGEVDIVARDGDVLVVVEVKTRRSTRFGVPAEAVGPDKLARLRRLALRYVAEHGLRPRGLRVDVVSVLRPVQGAAVLEHLRSVG